jgi:hypothetical protein
MAQYFSYLPDVYVGQEESDGRLGYRLIKNMFRRGYLDPIIEKYITAFETFYITDNMRPDELANKVYGDPNLDWVVLMVNNIIDPYTEWPKSTTDLNNYIEETYDNPDAIHHWETNEVKLDDGTIFVQKGIEVTEDYRVTLPNGDILTKLDSIYQVSIAEHETYLNEQKRLISLISPGLVETLVDKFESVVAYDQHPELDLEGNKRSPNSSTSPYINRKSYRTQSGIPSALGQAVTSFDYGPTVALQVSTSGTVEAAAAVTTTATTTTVTTTAASTGGSGSSSGSSGSSGGGGGY